MIPGDTSFATTAISDAPRLLRQHGAREITVYVVPQRSVRLQLEPTRKIGVEIRPRR